MTRCSWLNNDNLYIEYHDNQWGVPIYDDKLLFEMLVLESFHTGLSWFIILKKRENFRRAFDDFDANKIQFYNEQKINSLLEDAGIVRNKGKINATIVNAKIFLEIKKEFESFSKYLWSFSNNKTFYRSNKTQDEIFDLSKKVTNDMKKRGMKHIGTITIQSYLESVGIVNNHDKECFLYKQ